MFNVRKSHSFLSVTDKQRQAARGAVDRVERRSKPGAPRDCTGFYRGRPLEPSVHRLRLPVGSRAGGYEHGGSLSRAFTASIPEILKFFGELTAGAGGRGLRLSVGEYLRWTIPNEHRCLS